ncbi:uncharacterized protein TRIADDRAFT_54955 [Trichoplax adhaerens]|uniref:Uncharacterized protein n=1 Tax=Trichoplax adhaerens TaxID=10228 RepID=B3RTG3_TRIAD|nr:hypothetical protein TRIADDRAFT_54955 [Trichoplax adhaerens]EDV27221.1 hypothetical protein TRIADDRAFT_54955 [Trichoplax adhaerens]|eukprot:XP_002111217.1 hypothetical protein TRIADDRAFT_54955 [Trichoplax adhaerens]
MTLDAGRLAILDINNRSDILPEYKLSMDVWDTEYKTWVTTKSFFDAVTTGPIKIATFGPLTSICAKPVASIAKYWNLITIASGVSSAALINRATYPHFFTTETTDITLNQIRVALLKRYNWTRVATIHYIEETDETSAKNFIADAIAQNITLVTSEAFVTDPVAQVKSIKEKGARIILLFASTENSIRVICQAYHQGLYGPHYIWFITYGHNTDWWKSNLGQGNVNCSIAEIEQVLTNYFTFNNIKLGLNPNTISGMNSSQYMEHYYSYVQRPPSLYKYFQINGYDAMWALALALNKTENILKESGSTLSDFHYKNSFIRSILFNEMSNTNFIGISGPVRFTDGARITDVGIYQCQIKNNQSKIVQVGTHFGLTEKMNIKEDEIYWISGGVPADQVKTEDSIIGISRATFLAMTVLAVLAIICASIFLVINITHRKLRHIKMSSPTINNLFLFGCIICYIAAITFGIDSNSAGGVFPPAICAVIRDYQLIIMVIFLVIFDVIYLTIWELIDPLTSKLRFLRTEAAKLRVKAANVTNGSFARRYSKNESVEKSFKRSNIDVNDGFVDQLISLIKNDVDAQAIITKIRQRRNNAPMIFKS